ncbi:MAG: response regulator [Trueperaceae bacterium]|nr:response regulator [Trueperaceae bacterium]
MVETDVPTASAPLASGRRLIAVIDDDEAVLTLVRRVLVDHDVVEFGRPDAALRAFADGLRPHLVISDVQMPGLTGFELHEAVRRIAPMLSVPFVYLTAMSDRDSLRRGMALGADDYLTKPFTPGELREAVAARLARHVSLSAAEPATALHLVSLGGLSLALGEERLTWEARKVVELLIYLLDEGGAVAVDRVRQDLWSGPTADNHLHVLVSRLRKTLAGAGRVSVSDERVRLDPDVPFRWDVAAFEAACDLAFATRRPSDVESALAAYAGEFLGGFDSPWADSRRATLEDRFTELLDVAVEAAPDGAARDRATARRDAYFDLA